MECITVGQEEKFGETLQHTLVIFFLCCFFTLKADLIFKNINSLSKPWNL